MPLARVVVATPLPHDAPLGWPLGACTLVVERKLTIRVEPIYKETVRRRTGAARLIPPELVDPKVIRLPLCTEQTFRSFSGLPEASIWQLNLLYVGIDPDVVPEDRQHAQKVLKVLRDPEVYSDAPAVPIEPPAD